MTLLTMGCAKQEEALIFLHAPAWPETGDGIKTCGVDATSDVYLPRGLLDVAFDSAYDMPGVLLNNLLSQTPMAQDSGINNAEMQLIDADVRLEMPQDPEIIDIIEAQNPALIEFSVTQPANSIDSGEKHAVLVEVVTPSTSAALRPQIISRHCGGSSTCDVEIELLANVTFNAKRTGSSGKLGTISSREFHFPIDLCIGCLGSCAPCPGGICPASGIDEWVGGVCGNAQDAPLIPVQCYTED